MGSSSFFLVLKGTELQRPNAFFKRMKKWHWKKGEATYSQFLDPVSCPFPAQILYSLYPKIKYRMSFFCAPIQNISSGCNFWCQT